MVETLTVKTNDKPTMFNKEMAVGMILAALLPIATFPASLIAVGIGTLIGGRVGRSRMEYEQKYGKHVSSDPAYLRKDTIIGGYIGLATGAISSIVTVMTTAAALAAFSVPVATATAAAVGVGIATIGIGALVGAHLGSRHGQKQELHEYQLAKAQQQLQQQQPQKSRDIEPQVEQAVQKHFTRMIEEERARAEQSKSRS